MDHRDSHAHYPELKAFQRMLNDMLKPELSLYRLILLYSAAISLLSLVLPVSVQLLIDTVANIGRVSAVVTIAFLMFFLLLVSGVLYALRAWAMELFNRKLYSRLSSEIALTGLMAKTDYFEEEARSALFNRYFDIMTLKKNMPYLLSYGFTLFFQTVIGFVVVSLYHFYFFIFCLCFLLLVYLTWKTLGWKAISSGFAVSDSKHQTAAWLQGLAVNNGFFKAQNRLSYALSSTNQLIHQHLDCQQTHFIDLPVYLCLSERLFVEHGRLVGHTRATILRPTGGCRVDSVLHFLWIAATGRVFGVLLRCVRCH
jgi:ABC-type bacteriocin/lantibiotic exporter with double-glycine peptidase domain